MSHKNLNGLSDLEQHYFDLAEVYQAEYTDHTLSSKKIMVCEGIIVTMYGELLKYLTNNKASEKSNKQSERLQKLLELCREFSSIADLNYQLKLSLRRNAILRNELATENKKLRDELEAIKKAWSTQK